MLISSLVKPITGNVANLTRYLSFSKTAKNVKKIIVAKRHFPQMRKKTPHSFRKRGNQNSPKNGYYTGAKALFFKFESSILIPSKIRNEKLDTEIKKRTIRNDCFQRVFFLSFVSFFWFFSFFLFSISIVKDSSIVQHGIKLPHI